MQRVLLLVGGAATVLLITGFGVWAKRNLLGRPVDTDRAYEPAAVDGAATGRSDNEEGLGARASVPCWHW